MVFYIAAPPPGHKTCTKCGQCEKHNKCKSARDGLQSPCVQCRKTYRVANKDKINAQKKKHYEENKDEISARQKAYYEEHKDEINAQNKQYQEKNKDNNIRAQRKQYREENKDKIRAQRSKHYEAHKDEIIARSKRRYQEKKDEIIAQHNEYVRNRRQTDEAFRLLTNCRRRLKKALKGKQKTAKTLELIGCTPDELLEHLERTMSPEVRACRDEGVDIVVDHIIPCAAFDFSIPEHQRICSHYTNLQYLDAPTNMSKSDTLPPGFDFASWFEAARARVL